MSHIHHYTFGPILYCCRQIEYGYNEKTIVRLTIVFLAIEPFNRIESL